MAGPPGPFMSSQAESAAPASPKVSLMAEWYPRVSGFHFQGSSNSYAFGIERRTNRHVFGLIVTNNSYSTTARSIISGQGDLRVGFNLSRRLF